MTRDETIQALTVGLAAGGFGAGFALLLNSGFKSDDVFAFMGAVAGAAATVAGAMWLADRGDRAALERESRLLYDECADALKLTKTCLDLVPEKIEYPFPAAFQHALTAVIDRAAETRAILREAIARAEKLNFRQRVRVVRAESALDSFLTWVWDDEPPHPLDERTYQSTLIYARETLKAVTESLRQGARGA